jgi:hypothetical protein
MLFCVLDRLMSAETHINPLGEIRVRAFNGNQEGPQANKAIPIWWFDTNTLCLKLQGLQGFDQKAAASHYQGGASILCP